MRGANEQSYVNGGASVTHASVNEQMRCMILKKSRGFRCQFCTVSASTKCVLFHSRCKSVRQFIISHPHA